MWALEMSKSSVPPNGSTGTYYPEKKANLSDLGDPRRNQSNTYVLRILQRCSIIFTQMPNLIRILGERDSEQRRPFRRPPGIPMPHKRIVVYKCRVSPLVPGFILFLHARQVHVRVHICGEDESSCRGVVSEILHCDTIRERADECWIPGCRESNVG